MGNQRSLKGGKQLTKRGKWRGKYKEIPEKHTKNIIPWLIYILVKSIYNFNKMSQYLNAITLPKN